MVRWLLGGNELVSASGSWTVNKGSFKRGYLRWGTNGTTLSDDASVGRSFDIDIGYKSTGIVLESMGYFTGTDGKEYVLNLQTTATIFQ